MSDATRTPVLIGLGQVSERMGEPGYEALSPADLGGRAVTAALLDTGADAAALREAVDVFACTRQFDQSFPGTPAPLGRPDNLPLALARRAGLEPGRVIYEVTGGQSPQHLVTELCADLAAGRAEVAVVAGTEAMSTVMQLARSEQPPDFTEVVEGPSGDRHPSLVGLVTRYQASHGITDPTTQYALFENARRARLGLTRAEHARAMGELFAPFTEVAAANPHSAAPTAYDAAALTTIDHDNRMVADPYPKRLIARDKVNQAAAVVLTTEAVATELGVPRDQWVYLAGHADLREIEFMRRADLSASPSGVLAIEAALAMAEVSLADVDWFDLYSCYPIAVSSICDGLGLAADDPRRLTVTGGLPYFGGPGNNYSLHAIVEVAQRARQKPDGYGLVGANGGALSKYSVGVYTASRAPWQPGDDAALQAHVDAAPRVPLAELIDGEGAAATVESWTVQHVGGVRNAIVIGRLDDDRRFVANGFPGDDELIDHLLSDAVLGSRVFVRSVAAGNRVTLTAERMAELDPPHEVGFRDSYEHVDVRRDGHVLEIEVRDASLSLDAHLELADIVDAYMVDRDLWVALLLAPRGLGGDPHTQQPLSGLGGLTRRTDLHKPVVAAVGGEVTGVGFEVVLACHLIVADDTAVFALPGVRHSHVAGAAALERLRASVPPHVAHDLVLTGRSMPMPEALRWGLVSRASTAGRLRETVREFAAEVVAGSPTAQRLSLRLLDGADPSTIADEALVSTDGQLGAAAYFTGVPADWRNA
ncbi:MAG: enoyl-CoA hydratase-related protein [Nocardioides sp.]